MLIGLICSLQSEPNPRELKQQIQQCQPDQYHSYWDTNINKEIYCVSVEYISSECGL